MSKQYFTVEDFAGRTGVTAPTIRDKIRQGEIEAYKPGGKWLIPEEEIPRYVEGIPYDEYYGLDDEDEDEEHEEEWDDEDETPDDLISADEAAQELGYEDGDHLLAAVEAGESPVDIWTTEDGDLAVSEADLDNAHAEALGITPAADDDDLYGDENNELG